ncbi:DEAD/DEAH box helicase family protein [Nocardia sp. NBC_00565]|nr:DEAD/DEAH box helicase family protein [Nocardia sp. NBC_00565]WUC00073.1 DEAD/DEAH box helicase family protein [Nocardia sp. NBC_00565]
MTLIGIETLMASHLSRKRDEEIGRFGLGFKSVLGITDRPEIISRTGSVRFDRDASEQVVRTISPNAPHTPVLRIGAAFDPSDSISADPMLSTLTEWASTVIRLPLKSGIDWLGAKLLEFPPEFLLFAPQVVQLDLHDFTSDDRRTWRAERHDDQVVLDSGENRIGWRVFHTKHQPSMQARAEAGAITGRETIDVSWAVPDHDRGRTGSFWSFFPTNSQTTLSGIVNAPFKTNEDRHDILEGDYNREILISVLPGLVSANLHKLVDTADPGSILDILPARGRESRSWADRDINDPVMHAVAAVKCLPDMDGNLLRPLGVNLPPEIVSEFNTWKPRWAAVQGRPSNWLHISADRTTERRSKVDRVAALANARPRTLGEWLRALAVAAGVPGSQEAIKLAALIDVNAGDYALEMRRTALVLAADGSYQAPHPGRIFISDFDSESTAQFVHPDITEDLAVVDALKTLGIDRMDQVGRLKAHIARMQGATITGPMVEQLWNLTRGLPEQVAAQTLSRAFADRETPVRSMARRHSPLRELLLPGVIVPADGTRDAAMTIDTEFHAKDLPLLRLLGAASEPQLARPSDHDEWFREWEDAARDAYRAWTKAKGVAIQPTKIRIAVGDTYRGLDIVRTLSTDGRLELTELVLRGRPAPWIVDSTGGPGMPFTNPAVWWVAQHGVLRTAFGARPVRDCFAHIPGLPDELLPVAKVTEDQAKALGLRSQLTDGDWQRILQRPWNFLQQAQLNNLYGLAASVGAQAPDELAVEVGAKKTLVAPAQACVSLRDNDSKLLSAAGHPVIEAADRDQMNALINRWGLEDSHGLVHRSVLPTISGEATPMVDRFPGIRAIVANDPDFDLIPCSDLSVEVTLRDGPTSTLSDHRLVRDGEKTIYFLDNATDADLLADLNTALRLGLSSADQRRILDIGERREKNQLRDRVQKEADPDRKLVMLAGVKALRNEVPAGAVELIESRYRRKVKDEDIAALARASKGAGLLERLAPAIEEKGITLPRLRGGYQARRAIQELGLAPEFAGSTVPAPPPRFEVIGPVELPKLHDFQEDVVANLLQVLRPGGKNRGIVALPTGSGKTRVAVEALIRHVRDSDTEPLIIWIAQSDELCEQAVETWSYTWSAIAPPAAKLTISRLWGSNDTTPTQDGTHLVVATDRKLLSLSEKQLHEWLTDADVVLVDEAHTSISKTYTELFRWLKRSARERDRVLIGLSASPYRGHNEEQTRGLINRYDSNLLTDGVLGEHPHQELQRRGILARVRHLELDGMTLTPGKSRTKTESDAMHLDDYRIDLNAVATNDQRNRRILDSLETLPTDMTALVFTASVQHAELLAAVLSHSGIPASSIAGHTPASERRRLIERFKAKDVRVLTNYNVLSQGFDAPKVGAVYVTRPTFSPNRYQQMIGRGLRGPRNGGSEEVLIVNVRDNIEAFGTELAFHHFDRLWSGDER